MKITSGLLEKYALGQCSPGEKQAVERWLENLQDEISLPPAEDLPLHKARIWQAVEAYTAETGKTGSPFRRYWFAAACFLLTCGLLFFFYRIYYPVSVDHSTPESAYHTIRTAKGEKRSLRLSDGTVVYLNADSELRFPTVFSDTGRVLLLRGEAYLRVARDTQRPFSIRTSETSVTVLGTAFNVQAYPGQATTVVVQEGKVRFSALRGSEAPVILTANQRGRFYGAGKAPKIDAVVAKQCVAWRDNRLVFDNEPVKDITRTLERWYNVKVAAVPEHIRNERFTGEFENRSLDYVLEKMSYVMQFHYTVRNDVVTLH